MSGEDDPASQLTPYLRPGEPLLWVGRPDPSVRFAPADVYLVPFSIMWAGFALVWEVGVLFGGAPVFFVLWGIPFVVVGLYMLFGRFSHKRRAKLRTAYGVTSQRVLVAIGGTTLNDSPIKMVPTSLKRSRDGSHISITFGNQNSSPARGAYPNTGMDIFRRGTTPLGFYDVADVDALLAALERARSA
jgi:hypothetical protein